MGFHCEYTVTAPFMIFEFDMPLGRSFTMHFRSNEVYKHYVHSLSTSNISVSMQHDMDSSSTSSAMMITKAKYFETEDGRRQAKFDNELTMFRENLVAYERFLNGNLAFTRERFKDTLRLRMKATENPNLSLFYKDIHDKATKV